MSFTKAQSPPAENKMGVLPEGRLLFNMALPMIASMLVQALYNVVDSVYVSNVSESAVTALSLAFPVQNMQIALSAGVAVGVNSLLSRSLGEGNREKANYAAGNGIFLTVLAVLAFMLFGAFGAHPFFTAQSDVAETIGGGTAYVSICSLFSLGLFAEVLFERMLQSTGRTFYSMITQGTGAIINILLDPVFIFGYFGVPKMGVAGAAVATVIGQWVAAGLALFFNLKCNPDIKLSPSYCKPRGGILRDILAVGFPSALMMAISSVMNFGMNQILQGFSETATGVFGVYYKLQSFFFMPVFGLNNATISIVAYNYGHRKPHRILRTLRLASLTALGIMLLGVAAFQIVPAFLLGFFNPNDEFLEIGKAALRIISLNFPLAAFGIALSGSFQALGKGVYATVTSLSRQLAVLLPVAFLLSLTGAVTNVWWAFPISEFVSLVITALFFLRIYRKMIRPMIET